MILVKWCATCQEDNEKLLWYKNTPEGSLLRVCPLIPIVNCPYTFKTTYKELSSIYTLSGTVHANRLQYRR